MTRFATTNDMKQKLDHIYGNLFDENMDLLRYSGPLLAYNRLPFEELYIDTSQHHVGIVGSTGYGKSRRAYSTAVLGAIRKGENLFVVDTKTEHLRNFAPIAEKFGYRTVVINLNNPEYSHGYNPLEYVTHLYHNGQKDKAAVERKKIAISSVPKDTPGADPFWSSSAKNILFGSIMALLETADKSQVNFASLLKFINDSAKRDDKGRLYLTEFLKKLPEDSMAKTALEDYSTTAGVTAAGMRSNAAQALQDYVFSDGVNKMLANSDIKITDIDDTHQPVIYFLILPEQNNSLFAIASLFFTQLINRYIQVADRQAKGCLSNRLNIFVDELPAMGQALSESFAGYISTCRSRNIRIYYVIQSFEQLQAAFGNQANTILDNTGTMIVFRVNTDSSARFVTDMLGKYNYTNRYSGEIIIKDVLTTSDISSMDVGQAVVICNGLRFVTWLPDYTDLLPFKYKTLPALVQKPETREPVNYFDVKEYVKNKSDKKKPVRNVGSIRSADGDIMGGVSVDESLLLPVLPDDFEIDFDDDEDDEFNNQLIDAINSLNPEADKDNQLIKAINSFRLDPAFQAVTESLAPQLEKEVKSLTKRRLQHKYKVTILILGHDKEFLFAAARVCKVTVAAILNILYTALDDTVDVFFEDRAMAENFAGEIENSGGVAEFVVL